jgi:D-methionine transport system ATP-binding protein
VYGGISEIKKQPFGSLTWGLEGTEEAIAAFIRTLSTYTHVVDLGTAANPIDGFGYADLTANSGGGESVDSPEHTPRIDVALDAAAKSLDNTANPAARFLGGDK